VAEVLISIPYWRSPGTIRRAVDSILTQTYRDFVLVVLNDGDTTTPPWRTLADIDDPRLIRHDLTANRGRYFTDSVALTANPYRWWMPVDADDWIEPHRLAALLAVVDEQTDIVVTPWANHRGAQATVRPVRPPGTVPGIRVTGHLSSLWRTGHARRWCHPGQRVAWDQIMTTAAWIHGNVTVVDDPSYHRVERSGSLLTSSVYGQGTAYRRKVRRRQRRLWRAMRQQPTADAAAKLLRQAVPPAVAAQVAAEARRLRRRIDTELR
jgi:glycosyltransferase involved in cell wall biosynthesis